MSTILGALAREMSSVLGKTDWGPVTSGESEGGVVAGSRGR
jgi:hypothetical protein